MRASCIFRCTPAPAAGFCTLPCRGPQRRHTPVAHAEPPAEADDQDQGLQNKLNLPPEALQYVARGWQTQNSRSDVPVDLLAAVADLPMTGDVSDYQTRAVGLKHWRDALRKGTLPRRSKVEFPLEPFRKKFLEAMSSIEMPRFTRRYPALTDSVLRQMLEYTREFELEMLKKQAEQQNKQKPKQQPQEPQDQSPSGDTQEGEEDADGGQQEPDGGQENPEGGEGSVQDQLNCGEQGEEGAPDVDVTIESEEQQGEGGEQGDSNPGGEEDTKKLEEELSKAAEQLAEDLAAKFEQEMNPVVESIEDAMQHFGGDLEELLDGKNGWDLSEGLWQKSGWREFRKLRKKLANLRELRDLVRSLGRGGGKGPLRKAPEEVYASRNFPGVIRSSLVPEQVQGLHRSGNLTQMLPAEAALLAMGWPRNRKGDKTSGGIRGRERVAVSVGGAGSDGESSETDDEAVEAKGSHPARLLFKARLAEKALLSYERAGWLEDEPARVTRRMEMRPAGELGPIIVCLDTSGSMHGGREIVAKALVLECMRGAQTQSRKCYVYAFSGPGQVRALDLSEPKFALEKLLDFLECSFNGGTDVDQPLELALERLKGEEWQQADILMVTDGEIPRPRESLLEDLKRCNEDLGLEVHGLLVGNEITPQMKDLCTQLHLFKSWSAVGVSSTYGW